MHRRVPVDIAGRFMREDKEDHACHVVNMSAGGMALISATLCEVGEKIVVYLDALGRIEGIVVRQIEGGFAARIVAGPHKREKIVNQLTWLINRDRLGLDEGRRHERVVPKNTSSRLILPNGEVYECRVIDVSLSGERDARPHARPRRAPPRQGPRHPVRRSPGPGQPRPFLRLALAFACEGEHLLRICSQVP
jgi:hypothetical protein